MNGSLVISCLGKRFWLESRKPKNRWIGGPLSRFSASYPPVLQAAKDEMRVLFWREVGLQTIVYYRLFFVEEVTTVKKERQQQCLVKFNRYLSFSRNIDPPIWYDTDVKLFEIQRV